MQLLVVTRPTVGPISADRCHTSGSQREASVPCQGWTHYGSEHGDTKSMQSIGRRTLVAPAFPVNAQEQVHASTYSHVCNVTTSRA